jgi:hypothetical protein
MPFLTVRSVFDGDRWLAKINGSAQEFDGRPISCGLPEGREFGPGGSHALGL